MSENGNKRFLFALGLLSITDHLLAFLLFTNVETGSRQLIAVSILATSLIAYALSRENRFSHSKYQNLTSFRGWVLICSIISFLFIVASNIPTDLSPLIPKVIDALYIFTFILSGSAPFFLLFDIFETYVQEWADRRRQGYTVDIAEIQPKTIDKMSAGTKRRIELTLTFDSITKRFVGPNAPTKPCPHCLGQINFNERIEWLGPTAITCGHCGKVVDIVDLLNGD